MKAPPQATSVPLQRENEARTNFSSMTGYENHCELGGTWFVFWDFS